MPLYLRASDGLHRQHGMSKRGIKASFYTGARKNGIVFLNRE